MFRQNVPARSGNSGDRNGRGVALVVINNDEADQFPLYQQLSMPHFGNAEWWSVRCKVRVLRVTCGSKSVKN